MSNKVKYCSLSFLFFVVYLTQLIGFFHPGWIKKSIVPMNASDPKYRNWIKPSYSEGLFHHYHLEGEIEQKRDITKDVQGLAISTVILNALITCIILNDVRLCCKRGCDTERMAEKISYCGFVITEILNIFLAFRLMAILGSLKQVELPPDLKLEGNFGFGSLLFVWSGICIVVALVYGLVVFVAKTEMLKKRNSVQVLKTANKRK